MQDGFIIEATASGEEIAKIVGGIEEVLQGVPKGHCIISLLSLVILMSKPDISTEDLHDTVEGASKYICMLMDGAGKSSVTPANLMN